MYEPRWILHESHSHKWNLHYIRVPWCRNWQDSSVFGRQGYRIFFLFRNCKSVITYMWPVFTNPVRRCGHCDCDELPFENRSCLVQILFKYCDIIFHSGLRQWMYGFYAFRQLWSYSQRKKCQQCSLIPVYQHLCIHTKWVIRSMLTWISMYICSQINHFLQISDTIQCYK